MTKIDRRNEMAELEDDCTDGQFADFIASQESGDNGAWNLGVIEYQCPQCNGINQLQNDEIIDIKSLIIGWHEKAKDGDYFSRFVFEYLSFIAHLRNNLYRHVESDRAAVQNLKRDTQLKKLYLETVCNDPDLRNAWDEIIKELSISPLHNSSYDIDNPYVDKWWNSNKDSPNQNVQQQKGCVHSREDWDNMIEFWHSIRNNLFHGGKDPNLHRDHFLVEHAFKTLSKFMIIEIQRLI